MAQNVVYTTTFTFSLALNNNLLATTLHRVQQTLNTQFGAQQQPLQNNLGSHH